MLLAFNRLLSSEQLQQWIVTMSSYHGHCPQSTSCFGCFGQALFWKMVLPQGGDVPSAIYLEDGLGYLLIGSIGIPIPRPSNRTCFFYTTTRVVYFYPLKNGLEGLRVYSKKLQVAIVRHIFSDTSSNLPIRFPPATLKLWPSHASYFGFGHREPCHIAQQHEWLGPGKNVCLLGAGRFTHICLKKNHLNVGKYTSTMEIMMTMGYVSFFFLCNGCNHWQQWEGFRSGGCDFRKPIQPWFGARRRAPGVSRWFFIIVHV